MRAPAGLGMVVDRYGRIWAYMGKDEHRWAGLDGSDRSGRDG